jgi:hypothetical protein
MSRRSSKQRRAARRERAKARVAQREVEHQEWLARPPLTSEEMARVFHKFANMSGRGGVHLSFLPMGPIVQARNPEELREATERALIEATEKQDPS